MDTLQFPDLAMKTVTIQIASQDLAVLKQAGYQLCIAKQVDGAYDVIWQSSSQYLASNQFTWLSQFQIFAASEFRAGMLVQPMTDSVDIRLGQEATLDTFGIFRSPMMGGSESSVNLMNQYRPIHAGLTQFCTWIDGARRIAPIYVKAQQSVLGATALTPADRVLVWFEQNAEAGMMFSGPRSRAIEIDLTVDNTATRLYQNETWTSP